MSERVYLKELKLISFKNHAHAKMTFCSGFNGIAGLNGKGKTNLLDAIHYLSTGKSYFNFSDQQSIQTDAAFATVIGAFDTDNATEKITVTIPKDKKKLIKIEDTPCKKLSDFIGKYSSIIITPSDISIATQGSEERRNFMDRVICQHDKSYLKNLTVYNKLLEQRNKALKKMAKAGSFDMPLLQIYTAQMQIPAAAIVKARTDFIAHIGPKAQEIYTFIANENDFITTTYTSELHTNTFEELMQRNAEKDKILNRTSSGVHKDELIFLLKDEQALKKYGSQGQIKTWVMALKLASMLWLKQQSEQTPILLLDDVFEKLDNNRLENLLYWLTHNHKGQWFVTDAHKNRLEESTSNLEVEKKFFNIDNS